MAGPCKHVAEFTSATDQSGRLVATIQTHSREAAAMLAASPHAVETREFHAGDDGPHIVQLFVYEPIYISWRE